MNSSESTGISAIVQHYESTCKIIRNKEKEREWLLIVLVIVFAALAAQLRFALSLPEIVTEIRAVGISVGLSEVPLPITISGFWLMGTILLLRYYRVVFHIEKQYSYIHGIENQIEKDRISDIVIAREGKGYFTSRGSLLRHWTWLFYTIGIPVVFILTIVWTQVLEWRTEWLPVETRILDTILAIVCIVTLVLYLIAECFDR